MEPDAPSTSTFSLTDLGRLADVTPRTIRYYIAQGLLAAPTGSGQAARYSEGHLARLRLIRRLQREHLPLAEIRARLVGLSDEDVRRLVAGEIETAPPPTDSATDYIRRVLAGAPTPAPAAPARAMLRRASPHMASEASASFPTLAPSSPPAPDAEPDRSTWERVALTPDVELHLRRPLDRQTNKRVDRLIRIARELLEED